MNASRPSPTRIAVLGGGIMGCCTALCLARRGLACTLFEQSEDLLPGASRWNEGKIHLGYLYAAAPSLETARRVLPGGLTFRDMLERLLEQSIGPWISESDENYLFHEDSLVSYERASAYFQAVDELIAVQARSRDYLVSLVGHRSRELTRAELEALCDPTRITGGLRVAERSVNTVSIAEALARRVRQDPRIELRLGSMVTAVQRADSGAWRVVTGDGTGAAFDVVVNALWAGRPRIDLAATGRCDERTHHRYRVSAFIEGPPDHGHPSVVIAAGPFGDVKNHGGGRHYASWYPAGLLAQGDAPEPPEVPPMERADFERIVQATRHGLADILPGVDDLFSGARSIRIEGGWVYAQASGALEQPASTLHRRELLGIREEQGYFSVDTGKYSSAPWLAERLADAIANS